MILFVQLQKDLRETKVKNNACVNMDEISIFPSPANFCLNSTHLFNPEVQNPNPVRLPTGIFCHRQHPLSFSLWILKCCYVNFLAEAVNYRRKNASQVRTETGLIKKVLVNTAKGCVREVVCANLSLFNSLVFYIEHLHVCCVCALIVCNQICACEL